MNTIGERLKIIRKHEGLKQSDFAKRVLVSGSYISKVESGKEQPSESFIKLVSLEFKVSHQWLEFGTGNMDLDTNDTENYADYFERDLAPEAALELLLELNKSEAVLLQSISSLLYGDTVAFRCQNLAYMLFSISDILKLEINDNKKDLITELLFEYVNIMAEVIASYNKGNPNIDHFAEQCSQEIENKFHKLIEILKSCS